MVTSCAQNLLFDLPDICLLSHVSRRVTLKPLSSPVLSPSSNTMLRSLSTGSESPAVTPMAKEKNNLSRDSDDDITSVVTSIPVAKVMNRFELAWELLQDPNKVVNMSELSAYLLEMGLSSSDGLEFCESKAEIIAGFLKPIPKTQFLSYVQSTVIAVSRFEKAWALLQDNTAVTNAAKLSNYLTDIGLSSSSELEFCDSNLIQELARFLKPVQKKNFMQHVQSPGIAWDLLKNPTKVLNMEDLNLFIHDTGLTKSEELVLCETDMIHSMAEFLKPVPKAQFLSVLKR
jgi:hypothetical protein